MAFKLAKKLYKKEHEDRRDGNLGGTWKIRQICWGASYKGKRTNERTNGIDPKLGNS